MSEKITKKHTFLKMVNLIPPIPDDLEDPEKAYEKYMKAEEYADFIDDFQQKLREKMFELAEEHGEEDDKGSHEVKFENGTGFKKEARHYVSINQDKAKNLAREKGLDITKKKMNVEGDIVDTIMSALEKNAPETLDMAEIEEEVREDLLEEAYLNGDITEEEFDNLVDKDIRYALRKYK